MSRAFGGEVETDLVSGAEIGRRLHVSRERVRQWASDSKYGFPETLGRVGGMKLWHWREVAAWAEKRETERPDGTTKEPAADAPQTRSERRDRGLL
jgi:hypothetical protein